MDIILNKKESEKIRKQPTGKVEYDCDDCNYFPCHNNHEYYGSINKKVEFNLCGDHSKRISS